MRREGLKKFLTLIRARGLRESAGIVFEAWARNRAAFNSQALIDFSFVTLPDRPASLRPPAKGPLRISWVMEPFGKNGGGVTTILRAVHQLEQWGHPQRIYVLPNPAYSQQMLQATVRDHYFPIRSAVEVFSGAIEDCDALVATSWKTAYYVRSLGNTARKFYFVQDMEHLFFPTGSVSEFAKDTYRWGFHGIAAGGWIAEQLAREFGMRASTFGFAFDRSVYTGTGLRATADSHKRVLFYARPITERRGFELGMLALSLVARELPETEVVLLGYQGAIDRFPFRAITSGLIPPVQLAELYRSCDAALCLSLTNLSLLPLELMAVGCPVISNGGASVEWLLNDAVAELTAPTPECLARGIIRLIKDSELRHSRVTAGINFAFSTTWQEQIKKIEQGFFEGLGVLPH